MLSRAKELGQDVFSTPLDALTRLESLKSQDGGIAGLPENDEQIDENWIPLSVSDAVCLLTLMCPEAEREHLVQFAKLVAYHVHIQLFDEHLRLLSFYKRTDPDRDSRKIFESPELTDKFKDGLDAQIAQMANLANFEKLALSDWKDVTDERSALGLDVSVDFKKFDIEGWVRGLRQEERVLPPRFKVPLLGIPLSKPRRVMVKIYRRLIVRFRLAGDKAIAGSSVQPGLTYVKVFKDYPRQDIDMLLPGTKLKMRPRDYVEVGLPLVVGIVLAIWKMATNDEVFDFSDPGNAVGLLLIIASTVGYGVKAFLAYRQKERNYQAQLVRSLYYNQLDTNKGALTLLHTEAERQIQREALLAYAFLRFKLEGDKFVAREAENLPLEKAVLDKEIEDWLSATLAVDINFEVGEALTGLVELGLVEKVGDSSYQALAPSEAAQQLKGEWHGYFPY